MVYEEIGMTWVRFVDVPLTVSSVGDISGYGVGGGENDGEDEWEDVDIDAEELK